MILTPRPRNVPTRLIPHFVRLEQAHWANVRAEEWIGDVLHGRTWLWEVGAGEGIVLTKLLQHGRGDRELFIDGLAGSGMVRRAREIMGELQDIARQYGCRYVGGEAIPRGLRRVYDGIGAKAVAVRYVMEAERG